MEKQLSIIIPSYNTGNYIFRLVKSIKDNIIDYNLIEVIIVNDGSTDDTMDWIDLSINTFSDISIIKINQENKGVSSARNVGLQSAIGQYIWFLDGDDYLSNKSLENVLFEINKINNIAIDAIHLGGCICDYLYEDDSVVDSFVNRIDKNRSRIIDSYELYSSLCAGHTNYIWRKDFLEDNNILYPIGVKYNEDIQFVFHCLLLSKQIVENKTYIFYFARENKNSVSRNSSQINRIPIVIENKIISILFFLELLKKTSIEKIKLYNCLFFINKYVEGMYLVVFTSKLEYQTKNKYFDIITNIVNENKSYITINSSLKSFLFKHVVFYRYGHDLMAIYLFIKRLFRIF